MQLAKQRKTTSKLQETFRKWVFIAKQDQQLLFKRKN